MNPIRGGVLAAAVSMALAGCHFPGFGNAQAPTGQVVAKVGNREITLRELQVELGNASLPDPKARKAAEMLALNNIVGRVILANAAKQQGIDKTPDYSIQKKRAVDNLLVQSLQQKIAAQVPEPTKLEAQDFIGAHPDTFSERKIFIVDQIHMPRPSDPSVLKKLEPLKTLEQIEEVLKANGIPYQRALGSLDSVGADPRIIDQILKLPPQEVFVIPGGNGLLVNQIRETKVSPFTGDPALDYAQKFLARQRIQDSIRKSFEQVMATEGGKVQFNKDYAPPKAGSTPAANSAGAS